MSNNIYVTIVRTGKNEVTQGVPAGTTVRGIFEAANISPETYNGWSVTDEDGDTLDLDSPVHNSTALICGARVDGAA